MQMKFTFICSNYVLPFTIFVDLKHTQKCRFSNGNWDLQYKGNTVVCRKKIDFFLIGYKKNAYRRMYYEDMV